MDDDNVREGAYIPADLQDWIESDPYHPGPVGVRLRRSAVPVWAIIGAYKASGTVEEVASAYDLDADEVQAALRYFRVHKAAIEARLAANAA
ncbi:MAG: DUF433 domain-containing protein [Chloroflexi bacterium]|nr:DUF433 domain-containing protein [Chloroflexota bacterium]